jgi:uncharacterized membrane protein
MAQQVTMKMNIQRMQWLDASRGLAILWMTVFHLCFDLNHLGWIQQNFYADRFWTWQRTGIVSFFLFVAGFAQAVAVEQGQGWRPFVKRWMEVMACAGLVSLGSSIAFPQSWIYFGVLHGLAVMLVLARWMALRRWPCAGMVGLGAALVSFHLLIQQAGASGLWPEVFNAKALSWLGLNWRKPVTEDFVPLLPWMGVVCMGLACGQWICRGARAQLWRRSLERPLPVCLGWLSGLGRHSLSYYMLHQPVLIGLLLLLAWARSSI